MIPAVNFCTFHFVLKQPNLAEISTLDTSLVDSTAVLGAVDRSENFPLQRMESRLRGRLAEA